MNALFKLPGSSPNQTEITVSIKTLLKILLFAIAAIIFFAALQKAAHALLLVFIAFFLALALNAPVSWIDRHIPKNGKTKTHRALATSLSALFVIVVLGAFLASVIPPVYRQTQSLIHSAPQLVRSVRDDNSEVSKVIRRYHLESQVNDFSNKLETRLKNASGSAVGTLAKIGSSIFSMLTIIVLTFMMLVEGPRWVEFMRELLPDRHEERTARVVKDMYRVVKGYVNGQVMLAAIAALMLLPGLLIFHVSYPIALLGVVFICGLIPMVGHTIGAIIVTFVALFHSPVSALGILAYYIIYQQIENYLVQPRLQANTTDMSPLLVFMSVVIGVSFSGLLGGLVAIPIAGCLRVLILDYLQAKNLVAAPVVKNEIKHAHSQKEGDKVKV
ncbi:MAG TPA: AI-2E family transporter [Candidatus Saccharimonadales bacterium]|nr:AI-2E family transporter [Candidatus Saccharimonadales bacterium]